MDDWRLSPTTIDQIPAGMKLALFIDESGKAKYKGTHEHDRYFTLCGCLFTLDALKAAQDKMVALKKEYWPDGQFTYKKGTQRVTFHMSEISQALKGYKNRNNPFCYLGDNLTVFYEKYKKLVGELDFFVFSVTVDKLAMMRKYHAPYDPNKYALKLLLERVHHCIARFYPSAADSVVIMVESEGEKEDGINLKTITEIVDKGTVYQSSRCFSWVKGAYFCPKRNQEGKSYYGLEIADFCAYPIKMFFVKNETASEEFTIITPKVYCKGNKATGFGLKKVP